MYDLTSFRHAIKSNTVHHTVSKTQAAARAGVCFKTWDRWESGERQPVNLDEILLAVVFNSPPPKPRYTTESAERDRDRVKQWREHNPKQYKEYMREYMKRRRQKAKQK